MKSSTRYPMEKWAQLLLYTTEKAVKEVAYTLGFSDQNYFIRLFRKLTGVTPQEYRKRLRP